MMRNEYAFSRMLCIFGLAIVMIMSKNTHACLARINTPDINQPDRYHAIFIAPVTSFKWVPSAASLMDITPSYKIGLFPGIRPIHGVAPKMDEILVEGACGSPVPKVGEVGLFFQLSPGGNIIPLRYYRPGSEALERDIERIRRAEREQNQ